MTCVLKCATSASVILVESVSMTTKIANILDIICTKIERLQDNEAPTGNVTLFTPLTGLAVQSLRELVNCRGDLQTLVQNCPLALQTDIARPFHESGQIPFRLDVLTYKRKIRCMILPVINCIGETTCQMVSKVHQRSWWEIVYIVVKIANIHIIICTHLKVACLK